MTLVVALGAFGFDVLLNRVDLAFISDEPFLDFVELVVDVALQNLVLTGVVSHGMVRSLLAKMRFILAD